MRVFLLSICLVLGFVASGWARTECALAAREAFARGQGACRFEPDASAVFADETKQFGKGSAARICMLDGKRTVALFVSPAKSTGHGACFFWARDMDAPVPAGRFPTRRLYMAPAEGACPRQDDPSYLENDGVPDGIFTALITRWNAGRLVFPKMHLSGGHDIDFAKVYRTPEGRKRFVLNSIEYEGSEPDVDPSTSRGGAFRFVVADNDEPSTTYYFYADWVNGDLQITNIGYLLLGC